MKQSGLFGALVIFSAAICIGLVSGARSWKGVVFLAEGSRFNNGRTPAAIKRDLDFSKLDGAELVSASQKRLVTAARAILQDGAVGIELGHFVTRDENGQRQLACDVLYNRLSLRFEAEGIASAGEKPVMEIEGPCQTSANDITRIEPLWIPARKILETKPVNMDLDFHEGVTFRFGSMNGQWPVNWTLQGVRLFHSEFPEREVRINSSELRAIRPKPFVMDWVEPGPRLESSPN